MSSSTATVWSAFDDSTLVELLKLPSVVLKSLRAEGDEIKLAEAAFAATDIAVDLWNSVGSYTVLMDILKVPTKVLKHYKKIVLLFGPATLYGTIEEFRFSYTEMIYNCAVDTYYYSAITLLGYNNPCSNTNWTLSGAVEGMQYWVSICDAAGIEFGNKPWDSLDYNTQRSLKQNMSKWDYIMNIDSVFGPLKDFLLIFLDAYQP